jgi:hypothetical protein
MDLPQENSIVSGNESFISDDHDIQRSDHKDKNGSKHGLLLTQPFLPAFSSFDYTSEVELIDELKAHLDEAIPGWQSNYVALQEQEVLQGEDIKPQNQTKMIASYVPIDMSLTNSELGDMDVEVALQVTSSINALLYFSCIYSVAKIDI